MDGHEILGNGVQMFSSDHQSGEKCV